jgi:hypothetical protein
LLLDHVDAIIAQRKIVHPIDLGCVVVGILLAELIELGDSVRPITAGGQLPSRLEHRLLAA